MGKRCATCAVPCVLERPQWRVAKLTGLRLVKVDTAEWPPRWNQRCMWPKCGLLSPWVSVRLKWAHQKHGTFSRADQRGYLHTPLDCMFAGLRITYCVSMSNWKGWHKVLEYFEKSTEELSCYSSMSGPEYYLIRSKYWNMNCIGQCNNLFSFQIFDCSNPLSFIVRNKSWALKIIIT